MPDGAGLQCSTRGKVFEFGLLGARELGGAFEGLPEMSDALLNGPDDITTYESLDRRVLSGQGINYLSFTHLFIIPILC